MSPAAAPPPVLVEREPAAVATRLVCAGCGAEPPAADPFAAACPARRPGDDVDHVIARRLDLGALRWPDDPDPNPFVRYRTLFHAWHVARAAGWPDARYVGLVRALDDAVAAVDGHGFRVTPLVRHAALAERLAIAPPGGVAVKDETGNVAGSHKARHLFGILLELRVAEAVARADPSRPLAIASCGNAALAAAVVARAANRELRVFVPVDADPGILDRLASLGARVTTCPRRPGEPGDPTVARLREALAAGAIPFTCQGPDNGLAIEGGATLGWEIADELRRDPHAPPLDRVVVQVGGGALASGVALGLCEARTLGAIHALPRLDTVQTRGGFPLARAFERATADLGLTEGVPAEPEALAARMPELAHHRSRYMWPWETEPRSVAHGILDDETYDWLAVVRAMLATGGRTVVVDEGTLLEASALGLDTTGIAADETGTAGLAGLLALARERAIGSTESVAVIFSGVRRTDAATIPPTQPDRSSTS